MRFSLLPKLILPSLTSVTPELLQSRGVTLLMLDFDNTIVPYTTNVPTEAILQWFQAMQKAGIPLCVVSNSKNSRVPAFCETYGLSCVTHAKKPFSPGIQACLARFSVSPKNSALVGDQIFTDTLGANCAGLTSILVPAIHNHTFWLKLRHVAELPFIFAARGRRIANEKH